MLCELCGAVVDEGVKLEVEGSTVVSCRGCSGYGTVVEEVKAVPDEPRKVEAAFKQRAVEREERKRQEFESATTWELVDDYAALIHAARERAGLKMLELGKRVSEPESVIARLEAGKMRPSPKLARKLEKELRIKLNEPAGDEGEAGGGAPKEDLTLGDVIVVRKKGDGK